MLLPRLWAIYKVGVSAFLWRQGPAVMYTTMRVIWCQVTDSRLASTCQAISRQGFLGHCHCCACRLASRGYSKSSHLTSSGRTLLILKQGTFYCGLGIEICFKCPMLLKATKMSLYFYFLLRPPQKDFGYKLPLDDLSLIWIFFPEYKGLRDTKLSWAGFRIFFSSDYKYYGLAYR